MRLEDGHDGRLIGARTQGRAALPAFAGGKPKASSRIDLPAPVSPVSTFEPGGEIQLGLLDEDDVADSQRGQHGPLLRRRSGTLC